MCASWYFFQEAKASKEDITAAVQVMNDLKAKHGIAVTGGRKKPEKPTKEKAAPVKEEG